MKKTRSSESGLCKRGSVRAAFTRRSILSGAFAPAVILLAGALGASAQTAPIFAPGNQILGGVSDGLLFNVGTGNGVVGTNSWPNAESPDHAIDGVAQKYLNFGINNTGFLVNPTFNSGNGSVVTSMQLWTANDSVNRDPASYIIYGTNAALDFGQTSFDLSMFTQVAAGDLALPAGRGSNMTNPLNNTNSQTVTFANALGYKEYLIIFPTVKNNPAGANSMQIGEVQLFGIGSYNFLTWTGANGSVWNINTTQNWSASGVPQAYNDGIGAMFDDTATAGSTNITIQAGGVGVAPAAVSFSNNTLNYSISGEAINSGGSLVLNGTGSVTLNNSNNYAFGVSVNAGTLNVGATGSLGSSALIVNNTSTGFSTAVVVNFASAQSIGPLSGFITTPLGSNTATINLNGALTINQSADGIYSGSISGTGGIIKAGTATLTLNNTSNYTGGTTINTGALRSARPGDNPESALPPGQPVTVNANGTLLLAADDGVGYYAGSVSGITVNGGAVVGDVNTHSTLPTLTLNGGTITAADAGNLSGTSILNYILDGDVSTVANANPSKINARTIRLRKDPTQSGTNSPVTFNVPRGTAAVDLAVTSVVQDGGAGLIKTGNGILALSNANTYTGPTVINAGTLLVKNSSALGTGAVTINSGGILSVGANTPFNSFSGFTLNGGATLDPTNSITTLTDNLGNEARSIFSTNPVSIANGFSASFVYTSGGARAADGATFTIQNNSPFSVGTAGGGLGYGTMPNSAALQFNLYTGANPAQPVGTNFATGGATGTYIASTPVNLASGRPIQFDVVYDRAASTLTETLTDLITRQTYTNVFPNVDIPTAINGNTGYVGFTGGTGGQVASQTIGNFRFENFTQEVSLSNAITIGAAATAGIQVLPTSAGGVGSATLTGSLTLNAGATLNVTGGAAATDSPYTLTFTGSTVLNGNATINVANNGTGAGTTVLSAFGQPGDLLSNFTKTGPGVLVLSGSAGGYLGTTEINGGTLIVNGFLTPSMVNVNSSGTLGGTGTVGRASIFTAATLAPGNGIGLLRMGNLSMQNGSIFSIEVGATTSDRVTYSNATLAGTIDLRLTLLDDPVDFTAFTILDGSTIDPGYSGGGRFAYQGNLLDEGEQFQVTSGALSQFFSISYTADSAHDVVLTALPEPTSAFAFLSGAGLLAIRRRRPALKH